MFSFFYSYIHFSIPEKRLDSCLLALMLPSAFQQLSSSFTVISPHILLLLVSHENVFTGKWCRWLSIAKQITINFAVIQFGFYIILSQVLVIDCGIQSCSYQKKGVERSLLIDMLLLTLQQHLWFVWKHFHMFCFSCGYNQLFIPDDFFMAVYWCVSYHQLCSNSLMFLNNYFHKYCFCCCHTNFCLPEIGVDDCLLPKMLQSALQQNSLAFI